MKAFCTPSRYMAATGDRAPCVFIENQRIVGLDPSDPIQVSYGKPFPGEPTGISARDHLKMDWAYGHDDAPDSFNVLSALLGESPGGRAHVLEHSGKVAIRQGPWEFIPATASGGKQNPARRAPQGGDALYDLAKDPAESANVAGQHPEMVEKFSRELDQLRAQGRSRP